MATAEQIKSLLRSHANNDSEHFYAIALQVAAAEAKNGHRALAFDIRDIVDKARRSKIASNNNLPKELNSLVYSEASEVTKSSLVLTEKLNERIERVILEFRQREKLKSHGLEHRRKILLSGPPGTGKTMTAKVLAHELKMPLYIIQIDRLVTKFMGETSAKLRQIFDLIKDSQGVYLFDEFDAIGAERSRDNDVGEMRRVLNAFLQFIELDKSDSLIIAATNNIDLLDHALFRRFNDVLHYDYPDDASKKRLVQNVLTSFISKSFGWKTVLHQAKNLSHAELVASCNDAIKEVILMGHSKVNAALLTKMIKERQEIK